MAIVPLKKIRKFKNNKFRSKYLGKKDELKIFFQDIKNIENKINDFEKLNNLLGDTQEIYDYINKNKDYTLVEELKKEVETTLKLSEKIRYLNLLNDEADHFNAFLEIHAGAGGTESQDWAEILQRMYIRWADSKDESNVILLQEKR